MYQTRFHEVFGATQIEKFVFATNLGLRCVVYMLMRNHVCFSYVRGNSYIDPTTILCDSHGTAMIKLLKYCWLVRYQKFFRSTPP